MALITQDLSLAIKTLQNNVVAIPTETVYGLAANALKSDLVMRIFEIKRRPSFDPLIVHIPAIEAVLDYAVDFPEVLKNLAEYFWPGPLTLLLPKREVINDLVTSGLPRVGLRVPAHPLTLGLLKSIDFPLAAPSANPFGYISPTQAQHVQASLGDEIPLILDGGTCGVGLESTIVGMEGKDVCVYRLGGIALNELEAMIGKVKVRVAQGSNPAAPGMLDNHYAPRTTMYYTNRLQNAYQQFAGRRCCFIFCKKPAQFPAHQQALWLSENGDVREMAFHLFDVLRRADQSGAEIIIAEQVPETGLGAAINDRIRRASQFAI